jgi:hypothetical protein
MPDTLHDLKTAYVYPILQAQPGPCPHRAEQLAHVQCATIDMLRDVFEICDTPQSLDHALALSLTVPHLRKIWEDASTLGLPTPLESQPHT